MRAQLQEQEAAAQERAQKDAETSSVQFHSNDAPAETNVEVYTSSTPQRTSFLIGDAPESTTDQRGDVGGFRSFQRFPDVTSHTQQFATIDEAPELLRHSLERAAMQERQRSLEEEANVQRVRRLHNSRSMERMSTFDVSGTGAHRAGGGHALGDKTRQQKGLESRSISLGSLHKLKTGVVMSREDVRFSPTVRSKRAPNTLPLSTPTTTKRGLRPATAVKFKSDGAEVADSRQHLRIEDESSSKSIGRYRRNLLIVSVGLMLVFSAAKALQNLQTSVNEQKKLGVISMTILYGAMFVSGLTTPRIIARLTSKWSLVLGVAFHLLWIGANLRPTFYTLVPAAVAAGLGQSMTWCAQVLYFHQLSEMHRDATGGDSRQQELTKLNGVFTALFQTSHIWGNLLSSLLLVTPQTNGDVISTESSANFTTQRAGISQCGAHFSKAGLHSALSISLHYFAH